MGRGALFQASDTAHVELVEMADVQEVPGPRTTIGLQIRDVDEAHERLEAFGAKVKAPPRTREWGMYGFGAFDPNGVPINVYEPADSELGSPAPDPGGARWPTRT